MSSAVETVAFSDFRTLDRCCGHVSKPWAVSISMRSGPVPMRYVLVPADDQSMQRLMFLNTFRREAFMAGAKRSAWGWQTGVYSAMTSTHLAE